MTATVSFRIIVIAAVLPLVANTAVASSADRSLESCQRTVTREASRLRSLLDKGIGKCLAKAASETISGGSTRDAARTCAVALRKIAGVGRPSPAEAFVDRVSVACDPDASGSRAAHPAARVTDAGEAAGLQTALLSDLCAASPAAGVADVGEWIECAAASVECETLQGLSLSFPRAPEWLANLAPAIRSLGSQASYAQAGDLADSLRHTLDGNGDFVVDLTCGPIPPDACGNGTVDVGEECDQATLAGVTCVDRGYTGGTLRCGAACVFDESSCYDERFVDNGDGTISDLERGLVWERKHRWNGAPDMTDPHDADNLYPWAGTCSASGAFCQPTADAAGACSAQSDTAGVGCALCSTGTCTVGGSGRTVWEWLAGLNAARPTGQGAWRLPRREELESLVDYNDIGLPPVSDALHGTGCSGACRNDANPACSCTAPFFYWTASSYAPDAAYAWFVYFNDGYVGANTKTFSYHARAVQDGLP